jgi:hypothetical protein
MPASQRWWLLLSSAEVFNSGHLLSNVAWAVCSGLQVVAVKSLRSVDDARMEVLQVDEADDTICSSALKIAVQCPLAFGAASYFQDRERRY